MKILVFTNVTAGLWEGQGIRQARSVEHGARNTKDGAGSTKHRAGSTESTQQGERNKG